MRRLPSPDSWLSHHIMTVSHSCTGYSFVIALSIRSLCKGTNHFTDLRHRTSLLISCPPEWSHDEVVQCGSDWSSAVWGLVSWNRLPLTCVMFLYLLPLLEGNLRLTFLSAWGRCAFDTVGESIVLLNVLENNINNNDLSIYWATSMGWLLCLYHGVWQRQSKWMYGDFGLKRLTQRKWKTNNRLLPEGCSTDDVLEI